MFNVVARSTSYADAIVVDESADFNTNFDTINDKAGDIENWVNNLALLNVQVDVQGFSKQVDVSMFSDEGEEEPAKDAKIDKQILNISQIANNSEFISVQKGHAA